MSPKSMIPAIARAVGGIDDDVVRIEIVVKRLFGQARQHGKRVRFKAIEGALDQSAPLGRDGVDQRAQFSGVLKIPQQLVVGAGMPELGKSARHPCGALAEVAPQCR